MNENNATPYNPAQFGLPLEAEVVQLNPAMVAAIGRGVGYRVHKDDLLFRFQNGSSDPRYVAIVRRLSDSGELLKLVRGTYHSSDPVEGAKLAFGEVFGTESGAPMLANPENVYQDGALLDGPIHLKIPPPASAASALSSQRFKPQVLSDRVLTEYHLLNHTPTEPGYGHGV